MGAGLRLRGLSALLKRLVGYAAYMFGANTLTGLLTFGVSALGMVTRSKEAFGDYALYMRIYEIGQGLFIFGANASIQRFAADDPSNRLRFSALALYLFLLLLLVMGFAGIGVGFAFGWSYALALFGLPWLVLYWWGRYILRSNLDARREARLMMVASLSNSVFQFLFLTFTDYRDALIYGDALALFASGAFALIFLSTGLNASIPAILRTPIDRTFLRQAGRFAAPLWWSGQIFSARHQIQSLATRAGMGAAPMGALQGAQTMWQFATRPLEYLAQAALPGLVTTKGERSTLYRDLLRMCLVAFTFIGLAVAAGMPLVFQMIDKISVLFGRSGEDLMVVKYAEVPSLLQLLALGMPVLAFESVTNQYGVAQGRPRTVLYANVATIVTVLGSLYPLAMLYGLWGVVLSGVLGVAASAATFATVLYHEFKGEIRAGIWWTCIATLCCFVALIPVRLCQAFSWNWVVSFPAVALYLGGMLTFRILHLEDFRRIWRAYRRRGQETSG